jgi:tryptophan synthase alpha chain
VTGAERIEQAIRTRNSAGQTALVAYLTAGFPAREHFHQHLTAIAEYADIVEIGVPFTDPMADGVTIQRASFAALKSGVTLAWILDELEERAPHSTPLVLMSYLNPLLAFGLERLPRAAVRAGVAGFIVPDLPFEEGEEWRAALAAVGIALVQMVTPVTPPPRLGKLCAASHGFVYAVTMTGTTGRNVAVPDDVIQYLERVRGASEVPVCAGFGIRGAEQIERLRAHVDGVIVGSALVEVLERGADPGAFLLGLRAS